MIDGVRADDAYILTHAGELRRALPDHHQRELARFDLVAALVA